MDFLNSLQDKFKTHKLQNVLIVFYLDYIISHYPISYFINLIQTRNIYLYKINFLMHNILAANFNINSTLTSMKAIHHFHIALIILIGIVENA